MTSFYNGRLSIETLRPEPDYLRRFRGGDHRGEVAMIASNSEIHYVEIAEFSEQGIIRGNHYHEKYCEQLYVMKGQLLVLAKDIDSGEQTSFELDAGSLLNIKPRIAHAFHSLCEASAISMGRDADPFVDRQPYNEFII